MSEKAAAPAPDKTKGSKSKLPMIIAAVVLLAGGGGGGYYWYSEKQAAAAAAAADDEEDDEEVDADVDEEVDEGHSKADDGHGTAEKKKTKKKKKKKAADEDHHARLMAFEPFVVNLADPGAARFLRTNVQLVVSGGEEGGGHGAKGPTVEEMRVRSAILELLSAETSDRLTTPSGKAELKEHILERAEAVLEEAKIEVEDVLFSDFVIQY